MRNNLVIVPVGSSIERFLHNYNVSKENHWRQANQDRNYDILAVQYGEYEPEQGTYDKFYKIKGFKWPILKKLNKMIDLTEWEYIGIYDDDVILDYQTMNKSFEFAKEKNLKAFQISLAEGSESQWPVTRNKKDIIYTYTNFIEIMCPVFNRISLEKVLKLIDSYDVYTGWGIDCILSEYLETDPAVLHFIKMFHPPRPETGSEYDKYKAFSEMDELFKNVYPKIMQQSGRDIKIDYTRFKDEVKQIIFNTGV
jgi:hypothetical protein